MDYLSACKLLNINPARGLASAKEQARIAAGASGPATTLRRQAAAALILRTTPAQALAAGSDGTKWFRAFRAETARKGAGTGRNRTVPRSGTG